MTRSESMTKSRAGKQRNGRRTNGAPEQKKNSPPALTNRQARTEKIRFALYLKLALLMGLGWVRPFDIFVCFRNLISYQLNANNVK